MSLSRIFLLAIVFYLLYRFVFHFLVPIAKATKHVKKQFRDMHDRMQNGPFQQTGQSFQGTAQPSQGQAFSQSAEKDQNSGSKAGEYIDFEEVKEDVK